jgi:hypothetical protein
MREYNLLCTTCNYYKLDTHLNIQPLLKKKNEEGATNILHNVSWYVLGIFGKLLMSRVHQLGLRLFGATVWKLLIIKQVIQWKLNKIKIESYIVIWGHQFLLFLESPLWVRFSKVYFTIFRSKMWKLLIFEWILLL